MNKCKEYINTLIRAAEAFKQIEQVRIYNLVLQSGKEFSNVNWKESKRLSKKYGCELKQCFYNCSMIAMDTDLSYYEGWACNIIPVEHAWLVNAAGEVIDPTYCILKRQTSDYFGIEITHPRNYINRRHEPSWFAELQLNR